MRIIFLFKHKWRRDGLEYTRQTLNSRECPQLIEMNILTKRRLLSLNSITLIWFVIIVRLFLKYFVTMSCSTRPCTFVTTSRSNLHTRQEARGLSDMRAISHENHKLSTSLDHTGKGMSTVIIFRFWKTFVKCSSCHAWLISVICSIRSRWYLSFHAQQLSVMVMAMNWVFNACTVDPPPPLPNYM